VLFQEKKEKITKKTTGIRKPLTFNIFNGNNSKEHPVDSIRQVIFELVEPPNSTIISNSICRIQIVFKIYLLIQFKDMFVPCFIVLPDHDPTKCILPCDLLDPQKKNAPPPKEILQIIDKNFVYTADIPFSSFDTPLSSDQLNKRAIEPQISIKNFHWNTHICKMNERPVFSSSTPSVPIYTTPITLSIFQDITAQITIDENIPLQNSLMDFD
jgi:hypothetical protein